MAAFASVYHLGCITLEATNALRRKSTFSHASYATFRPSYPPALYDTVLKYHHGPKNLCVDLGCGHGAVARHLSASFTHVIGTDPSQGMLEQARSMTPKEKYPNVEYKEATAEDSPFLETGSVDMVVAGQAAHWFDYKRLFPELKRIVRPSGTLAFWGYKDHVFVDYPRATEILEKYAYGNDERLLGPYWPQPGRSIVEGKLRVIKPPTSDWEDIQRIEYEPAVNGPRSGQGTMLMNKRLTLKECMAYIRTWSSFHGWQERHPEMKRKDDGGNGDVVDEMFQVMVDTEEDWRKGGDWRDKEVEIEWGSGLLLARRR
jgi:SAM-dependent methyltransferase